MDICVPCKSIEQVRCWLSMLIATTVIASKKSDDGSDLINTFVESLKAYHPGDDIESQLDPMKLDQVGDISNVFGADIFLSRSVLYSCIVVAHIYGAYSGKVKSLVHEWAVLLNIPDSAMKLMEVRGKSHWKSDFMKINPNRGGK